MSFVSPFIFALCALPPIPPQYQNNPLYKIPNTNSCLRTQPPYTHSTLPPPPFKSFDRLKDHIVYIILATPPSPATTKLTPLTLPSPFPLNLSVTNTHHIHFISQGVLLCDLSILLVRNINYTLTYFLYNQSFKLIKLLQFYYFQPFIIIYNKNDIFGCIEPTFHVSPTSPIIYSINPLPSFQPFASYIYNNHYELFYYFQHFTEYNNGNIISYCIKGTFFTFFCVSNLSLYKHSTLNSNSNSNSSYITNLSHVSLPFNLFEIVFLYTSFMNIYALVTTIYRLTEISLIYYNLLSIFFYKNQERNMSQLLASGKNRFSPYSKGLSYSYSPKYASFIACLKISSNNQFIYLYFNYLYIFLIVLVNFYFKKTLNKISNG